MACPIGIFFGSETGNTERAAFSIQAALQPIAADVHDVASVDLNKMREYSVLLFGVSTWHYGEMQGDWEWCLPGLPKLELQNKFIGLFGCGDQEDYAKHFCNAMGNLHHFLTPLQCQRIGLCEVKDYFFENSTALLPDHRLVGLALDEDRQAEKTAQRIQDWVHQLKLELSQAGVDLGAH